MAQETEASNPKERMKDICHVIRTVSDAAILSVLTLEDKGCKPVVVDPVDLPQYRKNGENPPRIALDGHGQ
jgi:hypothetical protein